MQTMLKLRDEQVAFTVSQLCAEMICSPFNKLLKQPVNPQPCDDVRSITLARLQLKAIATPPPVSQHFSPAQGHVLLRINFEEDADVVAEAISNWVASPENPSYLQGMEVLSSHKGRSSSFIVVSIPICAWLVLRGNPAYTFVDSLKYFELSK